jgi:hypothetical protein
LVEKGGLNVTSHEQPGSHGLAESEDRCVYQFILDGPFENGADPIHLLVDVRPHPAQPDHFVLDGLHLQRGKLSRSTSPVQLE